MVSLPSPSNISYWWNIGSLLGFCLVLQLITGVFLAIQFTGDTTLSFEAVSRISQDVNFGWLLRALHANGARAFFVCLYLHTGRGIYYRSGSLFHTWIVGVRILLLVIGSAFLGYVLPWGQMSFWGASVITSLIQAIPYLGNEIVMWLWGGFSVDNPTLTRFFTLHFLLPFLVVALVGAHFLCLHKRGSRNPLAICSNFDKIEFHSTFSIKDWLGGLFFLTIYLSIVLLTPWMLGDPENFILANPLLTPVHIQPEWYFLFAYAILRSIPNKLGGVLALAFSVVILYLIPFLDFSIKIKGRLDWGSKVNFWFLVFRILLLTWIGARPVEDPYVITGQILTITYFIYFSLDGLQRLFSDSFLFHNYILNVTH